MKKRARSGSSTTATKAGKSRDSSIASSVATSNKSKSKSNADTSDTAVDDVVVGHDTKIDAAAADATAEQSSTTNVVGANPATVPQLFEHLHLRCVVKESHNTSIRHVVVNRLGKHFDNLVATVGDKFASIYTVHDDSDVLDLFSIFENHGPVPSSGALTDKDLHLYAATWIVPLHERDAFLAVGGEDCVIHIVSLAHQDEFFQLKGSLFGAFVT